MSKRTTHKMTIGIVLSSVPSYSETFFRNKIKGLQDHGYRVILFVDYLKATDSNIGCKVLRATEFNTGLLKSLGHGFIAIFKSVFLHPKRSLALYRLNKQDAISIKDNCKQLILNQYFLSQNLDWLHFGFGMFAFNKENVAKAIGAKMAVSFRGSDLYLSPLKHKNCYDRLFLKDVQYHVLSQEMKRDLMDYKIAADSIKVIPPAINVDFFKTDYQPTKGNVIKLITVARLHWKKGLEYTLEALKDLKEKGIHFHYTIIGDGVELERLTFAVHQLDLSAEVTFTGSLSPEAVKSHLAASDVYLQYSIQEGFCNAVLEAQAMGLMCVVSNAEGLNENVLHNTTGWVVPKRQPKLLAQKIEDVIHLSSEEKQTIRNVAIHRVRGQFNLANQHRAFIDFYEN